jgi:vacuolar protein sorting-associated protein 35
VITKVFPDEYHLHTLDLVLSNIARLNPHVDMKKIVTGLMDRLSSYAVRDAETPEDPAKRKEKEEDAVARLLGKLQVSEGKPPAKTDAVQENGTKPEQNEAAEEVTETPAANGTKPGIPSDIKLYEIFYDQVVNLIKTRGLPVQDTIALLVSLVNLAL